MAADDWLRILMGEWTFEVLRTFFRQYGYWAVALGLLLENAGVPVPGETILLFASFLAYSEHELRLPYIILVGIAAATVGDNLGFAIGHHGGRPLLERYKHLFRISDRAIARGEKLFTHYGPLAVFFARFIFGLRVITGPLAGVLRMRWKGFALYNFLGATAWVMTIATLGYLFGSQWEALVRILKRVNLGVFAALALLALVLWLRHRGRSRIEGRG